MRVSSWSRTLSARLSTRRSRPRSSTSIAARYLLIRKLDMVVHNSRVNQALIPRRQVVSSLVLRQAPPRGQPGRQPRLEPAPITLPAAAAHVAQVAAVSQELEVQVVGKRSTQERLDGDERIVGGMDHEPRQLDPRDREETAASGVVVVGRSEAVASGCVTIVELVDRAHPLQTGIAQLGIEAVKPARLAT